MSAAVVTLNVFEGAISPALRVTPLRTKELAPAGRTPFTTETVIKSNLLPMAGVMVMTFEAVSVTQGEAVVAVNLPEGAEPVQVTTEEKAVKKPTGKDIKISFEKPKIPRTVVVVKDTVARAPITPG